MSIHAIVGLPGAGKSYSAAQRCLDAVQSGRVVITNLPLRLEHPAWQKAKEDDLLVSLISAKNVLHDTEDSEHLGWWGSWSRFIDNMSDYTRTIEGNNVGPLILVDEAAGTFFDMIAATKDRKNPRKEDFSELQDFFRTHRHHLCDIILLYQSHSQTDGATKALIERWHRFINTKELTGFPTWKMVTTAKGFSAGSGANLAEATGKYRQEIFDLYNSHGEGAGKETKGIAKKAYGLLSSRPIWLRWWFILLIIAVPLMLFAGYRTVKNVGSAINGDPPVDALNTGQPTQSATRTAIADPSPSAPSAIPEAGEARGARIRGEIPDHWPQTGAYLKAFDSFNVYFTDGTVLDLVSDIQLKGFRVLTAQSCQIEMLRGDPSTDDFAHVIYYCSRGF